MINKNVPLVSVIVTTYNRKEYLKETLDSILNQTFKDSELIVVDNFSNYDFIPFIKSFKDNRIRYFQNENNGIIAVNRNFGIKKAKGKYIAFCDDDDLWMKEKLEKVVNAIHQNPEAILYCHNEIMVVNGKEKKTLYYGPYKHNMYEFLLFKGNCISTSAVCLKKSVALETGGFSERSDFISVEDYEFWLRLSKFGKFHFIDEILGKYIIHGNNIIANCEKHANAYVSVISHHLQNLDKNFIDDKIIKKRYSRIWYQAGKILLQKYEYKKSRKYFYNSLKYSIINLKNYIALVLSFFHISIRNN